MIISDSFFGRIVFILDGIATCADNQICIRDIRAHSDQIDCVSYAICFCSDENGTLNSKCFFSLCTRERSRVLITSTGYTDWQLPPRARSLVLAFCLSCRPK